PAVIYGHGQKALPVCLPEHDLELLLAHGARLLDITLDKKPQKVLIKEVQHDHLGMNIVHVDLVRVSLDEKIHLTIPIELRGAVDAASHGGGVVEQHLSELEIECLASNIPDSIQLPVGKLALGDSVRVKDLSVEKGVTVLSDPEILVVSVKIVAAEIAAEEAAPEAEPQAEEPEVIGQAEQQQSEKKEQ
ncbi:MAG: 50S ribosomal protein L25, partial [Phycisphaerae bacterium]|nr:50S ribosomal protein L25 [Phycisphaerae bacterium]